MVTEFMDGIAEWNNLAKLKKNAKGAKFFYVKHCKDEWRGWQNFSKPVKDFELKKVLLPPPLGNFADISYLKENFKPHLLRDVCTLCSGALVSDSLLHMLL